MNHIIISKAIPEDSLEITFVRRATWLTTYPNEKEGITKEDIETTLAKRTVEEESQQRVARIANNAVWVAKDNNKVIGFIECSKKEKNNKITSFYILSEYQDRGIGTQLMEKALEWLGKEKQVSCEVASYNSSAITFYKKFGFKENGPTTNQVAGLVSGKEIPEIEMIRGL